MAGSVNKVQILGNLARDPETRTTQSGMKIVNMTVATSDRWKDKTTGEQKEQSEFHRVVIMNDRIADVAERFLRKGSKVYLSGKLQTRKWTDQSGQEKYTTEVLLGMFGAELVLLDKPSGDTSRGQPASRDATPKPASSQQRAPAMADFDDSEIPF